MPFLPKEIQVLSFKPLLLSQIHTALSFKKYIFLAFCLGTGPLPPLTACPEALPGPSPHFPGPIVNYHIDVLLLRVPPIFNSQLVTVRDIYSITAHLMPPAPLAP